MTLISKHKRPLKLEKLKQKIQNTTQVTEQIISTIQELYPYFSKFYNRKNCRNTDAINEVDRLLTCIQYDIRSQNKAIEKIKRTIHIKIACLNSAKATLHRVLKETKSSVSSNHSLRATKVNYNMAVEAARANIATIDSMLYLFNADVAKHMGCAVKKFFFDKAEQMGCPTRKQRQTALAMAQAALNISTTFNLPHATAQFRVVVDAINSMVAKEDPLFRYNKNQAMYKNDVAFTVASKAFDLIFDIWCDMHIAHSFHIMHAIHAINTSLEKVKDRPNLADVSKTYQEIKRLSAAVDKSLRIIKEINAKQRSINDFTSMQQRKSKKSLKKALHVANKTIKPFKKELYTPRPGELPIDATDYVNLKLDNIQVNKLVSILEGFLSYAYGLTTYKPQVTNMLKGKEILSIDKRCLKDIQLVKNHMEHNDKLASAIYAVRSTTKLVLDSYRNYRESMPHLDKAHYKAKTELLAKKSTMAIHNFKHACSIFDILQENASDQDERILSICERVRANIDLASFAALAIDHGCIIDITDHTSQVIFKTYKIVDLQSTMWSKISCLKNGPSPPCH